MGWAIGCGLVVVGDFDVDEAVVWAVVKVDALERTGVAVFLGIAPEPYGDVPVLVTLNLDAADVGIGGLAVEFNWIGHGDKPFCVSGWVRRASRVFQHLLLVAKGQI